ncbi:helix-turn-helix domain-containing protein [Streptomyces sp. SID7805]|uniref:helix-turn-helix domain-containing protein n=1 Tax=Streptomyces sp. SID7805 TaxID=2690328 RepID=UPI000699BAAA
MIAVGVPGAALAGSVLGYVGFGTEAALPEVQRILPVGTVMLVLAFGAGSRQLGPAGALNASPLCVIGLHDHPTLVEHTGPPNGVGVGLTPHGAYTMLGVALRELSNTITDLADLLGDRAWWLQEQLRRAPTWEARFTMLDRTLGHWLQYGRTPDTLVVHAWQRLRQTVGRLPIGELARELGCSRRHLERRFSEQVGLPPKTVARVWRFKHAASMLSTPGETRSLSEIAYLCGYSDQAHLNHDFRALTGCPPSQLTDHRTLGSQETGASSQPVVALTDGEWSRPRYAWLVDAPPRTAGCRGPVRRTVTGRPVTMPS